MLVAAHSKLLGAGLHAAAHHQPIARLKDVQRAGHPWVRHRADKYGNVLCKAANQKTEERKREADDTQKTLSN